MVSFASFEQPGFLFAVIALIGPRARSKPRTAVIRHSARGENRVVSGPEFALPAPNPMPHSRRFDRLSAGLQQLSCKFA